jgi:integrase/recombinase XerD
VPFGRDLSLKINEYLRKRSTWVHHSNRGEKALLLDLDGRRLGYQRAYKLLTLLWRQLGLRPARGKGGPRPTDLRHAFARDRLAAWDRQGLDVNAQLPWLSAYMGHKDLLGTEIYLHSTPELLRRASRRFEKRFRQADLP